MTALTGSPRVAIDPANAIANLLYALLEAESTVALTAVGLDPGIGILHTDQRARDSLALDLMEAVRPAVDHHLLDMLASRSFRVDDFAETSAGQCRIMPGLARQLAGTTMTWAGEVAPHAEQIARTLARDARIESPPTTLAGGAGRAARPPSDRTQPFKTIAPQRLTSCHACGIELPHGGRRCPSCHHTANAERLRAQQATEADRRRSTGDHPSGRPDMRTRIAAAQRAQWSARREIEPSGGFTGKPSEFRRLILPRLAGLQPRELARETGLSPGYCAQVRDGKLVPHVRHWAALQLVGLRAEARGQGESASHGRRKIAVQSSAMVTSK